MRKRRSIACLVGLMLLCGYDVAPAAQPTDRIVLYPDGNPVNIILDGMDQSTGHSFDPRTERPSDWGYVFLESVYDGLLRRDIYVTPDTYNIENAFADGGTIVLSSGTYYFSTRSSWYYDDGWISTSMDFRLFDAGPKDFVLKGRSSGKNGPMATIITDQFLHIGGDPLWWDYMHEPSSWDNVRTVNQRFENIAFDNSEYLAFRDGRSTTLIGQAGKANIDFHDCLFSGGGVTFHAVGSVEFRDNAMDNTVYGVSVVNLLFAGGVPADANVQIRKNNIVTQRTGIQLVGNSQEISSTPKTMRIVKNRISAGEDGIWLDSNVGVPVVRRNIVSFGSSNLYAAGISAVVSGDGVIKDNEITSTASTPAPYHLHGIMLAGSSDMVVRSNRLKGNYDIPLLIDRDFIFGTDSTSDSNKLIDNKLRKSNSSTGVHIHLTEGTSENIVLGGGISQGHISVLDEGDNNHVGGNR